MLNSGFLLQNLALFAPQNLVPLQVVNNEDALLERLSHYSEPNIKIVRIEKTTEPLGATVKNEGEAVVVARIIRGGTAEASGLLHEGDEILEVNEIELRGKDVNEVCDILARMQGTLTFLVVPTRHHLSVSPASAGGRGENGNSSLVGRHGVVHLKVSDIQSRDVGIQRVLDLRFGVGVLTIGSLKMVTKQEHLRSKFSELKAV